MSTHLPRRLDERMVEKKEVSIYTAWVKEHIPPTIVSESEIVGITELPIISPIYDEEQSRFILKIENQELQNAIERYLTENPGCDFWQQFDPRACSWEDVLEELDKAKVFYDNKARKNPARRVVRNHAEGISRLEDLLSLVPQEYGGGLLQAAFKIIFQAVKQRAAMCTRIFKAFEEIPQIIANAEGYRTTYVNSRDFSECYSRLHYELAKCIPLLINLLLRRGREHRVKTRFKRLFSDGVAGVEGILEPLKQAEEKLLQCQKHLSAKIDHDTHVQVGSLRKDFVSFQKNMVSLEKKVVSLGENVVSVGESVVSLDKKVDYAVHEITEFTTDQKQIVPATDHLSPTLLEAIRNIIHETTESHLKKINDADELLRSLQNSILGNNNTNQFRNSLQAHPRPGSSRSERRSRLGLTLLSHPSMICTDRERDAYLVDRHEVRRALHDFSDAALARASYLMATPRFLEWLTDANSDILLVDGHCEDQATGRISPLSSFCAGLAETLSRGDSLQEEIAKFLPDQRRIVLSFFCGEHSILGDGDGLVGPHGLIRCLIDQLFTLWPYREPPDISTVLQRWDAWNLETFQGAPVVFLCHVFEQLLRQLGPEYSVYCIIDGVSYFETDTWGDWAQELGEVVDSLVDFICDQRDGLSSFGEGDLASLKVLLVSPERSTEICWKFPEESQVSLRAGNTGQLSSWLSTSWA